jgi:periplasmic divalent cation tolerance protein
MTEARIVLTTIGSVEEARTLSHALVEGQLAACVNLVERVHSIYRWQGTVETADEALLLIKTTAGQVEALKKAVHELHPYALPEFLVLAVEDAAPEFLRWLLASTHAPSGPAL